VIEPRGPVALASRWSAVSCSQSRTSARATLVYLGLEFQRSFVSNTLRGVSTDAEAVIAPLMAWIRDAPGTVGLRRPPATLAAIN
jgi:hypothetical protein